MNCQLLLDGIKAGILGMGMVYLFLIVMIWIMHLTSKLLKPYSGLLEKAPANANAKPAAAKSPVNDRELAQAAVTAVQMYRRGNFTAGTQSFNVPVNGAPVRVSVAPGATADSIAQAKPQTVGVDGAAGLKQIKSPLPGTIVAIGVSAGDQIAAGDRLAVIEAMKMETEITAESSGTVREVMVSVKDVVAADDLLFLFEVTK